MNATALIVTALVELICLAFLVIRRVDHRDSHARRIARAWREAGDQT